MVFPILSAFGDRWCDLIGRYEGRILQERTCSAVSPVAASFGGIFRRH
jgi:hypothetical protein